MSSNQLGFSEIFCLLRAVYMLPIGGLVLGGVFVVPSDVCLGSRSVTRFARMISLCSIIEKQLVPPLLPIANRRLIHTELPS